MCLGVDRASHERLDIGMVECACDDVPENVAVQVFYPGYSTSVRPRRLCAARNGDALRAVLTHLATSERVAYIDDGNTWRADYLAPMSRAIADGDYAWRLRWFVHHHTRTAACG